MSSSYTKSRYESARLLLSHSDPDQVANVKEQRNSLQVAVQLMDVGMCCFLICVGNISPLSLVSSDSPSQTESGVADSGEEENMLHQLGKLLDVEVGDLTEGWESAVGSMTEMAVRLLTEEHGLLDFWD